ncbi:hypothetical protein RN001_007623 [Aquatica leii]|uniref:Uncharacterized protein n=1 Tax=Aquatica leii TaxID=1421715 RepID=A0AAN7P8K4_9COLE|nr:hypothetical protein RN001_007623 [Aquatica leii]
MPEALDSDVELSDEEEDGVIESLSLDRALAYLAKLEVLSESTSKNDSESISKSDKFSCSKNVSSNDRSDGSDYNNGGETELEPVTDVSHSTINNSDNQDNILSKCNKASKNLKLELI